MTCWVLYKRNVKGGGTLSNMLVRIVKVVCWAVTWCTWTRTGMQRETTHCWGGDPTICLHTSTACIRWDYLRSESHFRLVLSHVFETGIFCCRARSLLLLSHSTRQYRSRDYINSKLVLLKKTNLCQINSNYL